jgi:hypothetical protein
MKADTALLLKTVIAWIETTYGATMRSKLRSIDVNLTDENVHLPIPAADSCAVIEFEPLPIQAEILLALRRGDLTSNELAKAVKCEKNRIFEKGRGLDQLQESGLVAHKERVGYYLTQEGERRAELIASRALPPARPLP